MRNKNNYAVLLVGGSGTRFWPMSRKHKPKQFLDITGRGTLFEQTLFRIKPMFKSENIFVVTNFNYKKDVLPLIKKYKIPISNILLEPEPKNTAPAVCWAAAKINKINKDAVMIVLPSDHLISDNKNFLIVLNNAVALAQDNHLMTLG
nr:mannose-1-phosphate guanylyltransferase/mannose-6-phosphate isomerase [Desulfobulbaceae bacterium]